MVELQGCRSRRSWGAATKKRVDLGSLFDVEHETTPPFVAAPQQRAFPKIRCDVTDRKASPDAPDFFLIFFWSSRPEHNQKPPTDTANRHCSLIPTRRKIAVFSQGGQSTAPLARGRSPAQSGFGAAFPEIGPVWGGSAVRSAPNLAGHHPTQLNQDRVFRVFRVRELAGRSGSSSGTPPLNPPRRSKVAGIALRHNQVIFNQK